MMGSKSQTEFGKRLSSSSGTAFTYNPSSVTSTSVGEIESSIVGMSGVHRRLVISDKVLRQAILNYLRFQRALGKTVVGADDVAKALSLSVEDVERAAAGLSSHGIRLEK
jgi:hypothetical protein